MQPETITSTSLPLPSDRGKFVITALNGTAIYVLAYFLVWGLYELAKREISRFFNLRGVWDPSHIVYSMADNEWWRTAIVAVYGIGPLLCVVLGLIAFRWFWKRERARRGQLKLLLLWVAFHCCNAVFGALLSDTFIQSGSWYVPEWLFQLGNIINVMVALLAGLAQLGLGYFGAVAFLQAHDSKTVMRYANRQAMVVSTLIVPWVAGSVFIALSKFSYLSMYEALHLMMMGLLVTPCALGCLNELFSSTVKRPQATHVAWSLVGLAVVVAVAWRLALSPPYVFV